MAHLNRKPVEEIAVPVPVARKLNRKPPAPIPIIESHWDVITMAHDVCFVCDKKIKPSQRKVSVGPGLDRHEGCDSNSEKWRKKFQYCKTIRR